MAITKESVSAFVTPIFSGFKKAFPMFVLIVGTFFFAYSIWGEIRDDKWKEFLGGMGKLLVVSGVFTFLVKWLQFSGIIKDEITKFIFEPKFLSNRKDLTEYWEKVSTELFRHKFQSISKRLLKDVKEHYLPIDHLMYYDDIEHIIEIVSYDELTGIAEITQTTKFTAIPFDKNEKYSFTYGNAMLFQNNETEVAYESSVKVNSKPLGGTEIEHTRSVDTAINNVINRYSFYLQGSDRYYIERIETKKYNIHYDNIMTHKAKRISHKMKIEIDYPKDKFVVELNKCGTLDNFNVEHQNAHLIRYVNKGVIYPEQGYYINVKRK